MIYDYEKEQSIIMCATYCLKYNWSLRTISNNTGFSKSTIHDWFTKELKYINDDLYVRVKNKLKNHKKEVYQNRDRSGKFKAFG